MVVTALLKIKEEHIEDVEKKLREMVDTVVKNEPHTLEYRLHKDQSDPSVFFFYEKYKDKESFEFHSNTDYFKALFSFLLPKLDGEPKLSTFMVITD